MAKKRKEDDGRGLWFRTERLFEENDQWYFHTREKTIEGPFEDFLEAQTRLEMYIGIENGGILPESSALSLQPIKLEDAS